MSDVGQTDFKYASVAPKRSNRRRKKATPILQDGEDLPEQHFPSSATFRSIHDDASLANGQEQNSEDSVWLQRSLRDLQTKKEFLLKGEFGAALKHLLPKVLSSTPEISSTALKAPAEKSTHANSHSSNSILALGLGSPTTSRNAQFQLAFLLIMRDHLSSPSDLNATVNEASLTTKSPCEVEIYDPIFTPSDILLLEKGLGMRCSKENKVAAYQVGVESDTASLESKLSTQEQSKESRRTFVFMPHCPRTLYENFLRSNWSKDAMRSLVLCWNDLSGYIERLPEAKLRRESPCIDRLLPYLQSYPLPTLPSPNNSALNDLAFQVFDPNPQIHSKANNSSSTVAETGIEMETLLDQFSTVSLSKKNPKPRKNRKGRNGKGGMGEGEVNSERFKPDQEEFWVLPSVEEGERVDEEVIVPRSV